MSSSCHTRPERFAQQDSSAKPNGFGVTAINDGPLPVSNMPDSAIFRCSASVSFRSCQPRWRQDPDGAVGMTDLGLLGFQLRLAAWQHLSPRSR